MKCISRILCIAIAASVLLCGCGQATMEKEYDAYSYHNSFVNQENDSDSDYFAKDFCVTDANNFGLEGTYARVAEGGGVFNVTTNEVLYNQNMFKKLYPASMTKMMGLLLV